MFIPLFYGNHCTFTHFSLIHSFSTINLPLSLNPLYWFEVHNLDLRIEISHYTLYIYRSIHLYNILVWFQLQGVLQGQGEGGRPKGWFGGEEGIGDRWKREHWSSVWSAWPTCRPDWLGWSSCARPPSYIYTLVRPPGSCTIPKYG